MYGYLPAPAAPPATVLAARAMAAPPQPPVQRLAPTELSALALPQIATAEEFEALSVPAGDLVANGRVIKFLIDLRDPRHRQVLFVNGRFTRNGLTPDEAKYHYNFARTVLGIPEALAEFNRVTYFSPAKRYAAGVLHSYLRQGTTEPVYGVQFYPQDVLSEGTVFDLVTMVAAQITIPAAAKAFVATGSQQTVDSVRDRLAAAGLGALTIEEILGSITYLPLNAGEAWGYLRVFPSGALTAADIAVFDELPLDLSVVAGVITRAVQDSNSHVNLKSKERGTPNMVLRDATATHPRLAPWIDRPVRFVVRPDDFLLEATTAQEIDRRLRDRNGRPWVPLSWVPETVIRSYDEMAAGTANQARAHSARYGGKAANLGFLAHRWVLGRTTDPGSASARRGYELVPAGFGVPLSFYRNLVDHPDNAELRAALDRLIGAEKAGTLTAGQRAAAVSEVQTLMLDATVPPDDLNAVKAALQRVLPGVNKIKIRSSANAEDVANFDGAGLHDSFAATVSKKDNPDGTCGFAVENDVAGGEVKRKVSPKSVACAIKGVYASLWNQRAIEERSNARIDHATVAMGLSVVPSYDSEADIDANAVVVTRVINAAGVFGYSLSIQDGNNLATNPDPGTQTESTIAALGLGDEPTSFTITRYAVPVAGGPKLTEPVLTNEQLLDLVDVARTVELAYCAAVSDYYPGDCGFVVVDNDKPTSLDLELKVLQDGRLLCKQVREFGGR